jgi:hypothetical protein
VKDLRMPEEMERKISAVANIPVRQQALRAAAAKQMARSPSIACSAFQTCSSPILGR